MAEHYEMDDNSPPRPMKRLRETYNVRVEREAQAVVSKGTPLGGGSLLAKESCVEGRKISERKKILFSPQHERHELDAAEDKEENGEKGRVEIDKSTSEYEDGTDDEDSDKDKNTYDNGAEGDSDSVVQSEYNDSVGDSCSSIMEDDVDKDGSGIESDDHYGDEDAGGDVDDHGDDREHEIGDSDNQSENDGDNVVVNENDLEDNSYSSAMEFDIEDFSQLGHFLCNFNTINDLVIKIANHSKTCCGKVIPFKQYILPKGHKGYTAFFLLFKCFTCKYIIEFCPSPLLNGRPISDYLVEHSKLTAGGLWENIERFTSTLGFSSDFGDSFTAEEFNVDKYCDIVRDMAGQSMQEARAKVIVEGNKIDGTFDASHLNRTNSACSCVSMLSPDTCQVLYSATVNRSLESISQNHEGVGTRDICQQMKQDGLAVRAGSYDGGSSSAGVLNDEFPESFIGNLDPYHGLKNDKSKVQACTKGKRSDKCVTWHPQLSEKCGPLMKHLLYAIKESRISVEQFRDTTLRAEATQVLQSRILIPLQHYQDYHDNCSPSSRCNLDPNYDLSRIKITDPVALNILERTLTSTGIFRNADKYLLNMPTSMNESYHNRQSKYFSKRTHLTARMYAMVIDLAILDHNENEDGVFENGERIEDLPLGADGLPKQPIQTRSFVYNILKKYLLWRMG